jgi:hypothetical protein
MIFFWPLLFGFLVYISAFSLSINTETEAMQSSAQAEVLGGQFLVYREAVVKYAYANPTVRGSIADSVLTLPNWFIKPPAFKAYAQAGKAFTYFVPDKPRPSLLDMGLYASRTMTSSSGVAANGKLISSTLATSENELPTAIPNGAIVYVN